jgi:hypothetical protein
MKPRERDHYLQMIGNDLDSVKHHCRQMRWAIDAIIAHLHIVVAPNALEETLNPSPAFLSRIVGEARGEFAATSKRQREAIRKRKWRRKKK